MATGFERAPKDTRRLHVYDQAPAQEWRGTSLAYRAGMFRGCRAYLMAVATTGLVVCAPERVSAAAPDAAPLPTCAADALPGLSAQFACALRETRDAVRPIDPAAAPRVLLAAGPAADFWRVAAAILGDAGDALVDAADVSPFAAVGEPSRPAVPCDRGVRARDDGAWAMGLSGYSAREIADVLGGHLSRADLDQARARLMAGQPRASVAAYLEARWREPATERAAALAAKALAATALRRAPSTAAAPPLAHLDADLEALARHHGVAPDLVRAVIAAESAGNPRAVSSAGAIGLMQLMPATAASLGVNPWQPIENLRGGISYLGTLLRAFGGNARLALIAYNAGPQHASRVRDGSAVAYRETRRYLDAIARRYPLP